MKKTKEVEELIKGAIRDELALHPLKSVAQVRVNLYQNGYQSVHGLLDWHYVSRLMKLVRAENIASISTSDRTERIAQFKERHRMITQKLASILEGEAITTFDKPQYPTHTERITAAQTMLKWDVALFLAEEQNQQLSDENSKEHWSKKQLPLSVLIGRTGESQ
jgi:hypothetical protein